MTLTKSIPDKELIQKGVDALIKELGHADAIRFLSMPREKREESVQRHRKWQSSLKKNDFFNEVFDDS